jgi:hypothetical protein
VILLNAVVACAQELQAERPTEALKQLLPLRTEREGPASAGASDFGSAGSGNAAVDAGDLDRGSGDSQPALPPP